MLAAYRRSMAYSTAAPIAPAVERSPYGGRQAANWPAIAVVALLHAALLFALVQLDIIPLPTPKSTPIMVTLIPDSAPPPAPEEAVAPLKPVMPPIVAPRPMIVPPLSLPPVIAVTDAPPPPQAIAVARPAPAPAPPAPITAPDASAASLRNPSPRYPLESRRRHEEGTVRLRVVITPDGQVKEIGVARSSGSERLDQAALETIRRWKFLPGMQAGKPVEAVGFLNIPFKLAA